MRAECGGHHVGLRADDDSETETLKRDLNEKNLPHFVGCWEVTEDLIP